MAFALPVVTLDLHGQGFLVQPDRGIRVPARDPASTIAGISRAITALYDDRPLLRRLSDGAFSYARAEALPNKFARVQSELRAVLDSCAPQAGPRPGGWPSSPQLSVAMARERSDADAVVSLPRAAIASTR